MTTRLDDPNSGIRTEAELLAQLFLEELEEFGRTISCSGQTFTTHRGVRGGKSTNYRPIPIWLIEEYLARTKHKPNVAERIKRLNPDGKPEGERPKGWHPEAMDGRARSAYLDTCSIHDFDRQWGKGAHRRIKLAKVGGKRKAVTGSRMMTGPGVSLKGWLRVT